VKIQLRNSAYRGADAVNKAEGTPGSPELLARSMLSKGFPMNPEELTISGRESGKANPKGDRRRPLTDGGAVL